MVQSLNSILRNELLNTELFSTVKSARNMATAWRLEYNHRRGHGVLGYQPPARIRRSLPVRSGLRCASPYAARHRNERQGMVLS